MSLEVVPVSPNYPQAIVGLSLGNAEVSGSNPDGGTGTTPANHSLFTPETGTIPDDGCAHDARIIRDLPSMAQEGRRAKNRVREVYFVRAVTLGLIKIGVTNNWRERLSSLQTFSPDKLELLGLMICPAGGNLEAWLHQTFHEHRAHGEWFRPGDSLLDFMVEHCMDPETADETRYREEHRVGKPPRALPWAAPVSEWWREAETA